MSTSSHSSGGSGLLAVIAAATIFIVVLEGVFIAYASWWALACVLLTLILMALVVVGAVVHVIDHDGLALPTPPRAQEAARPEPAPVGRPVLGH